MDCWFEVLLLIVIFIIVFALFFYAFTENDECGDDSQTGYIIACEHNLALYIRLYIIESMISCFDESKLEKIAITDGEFTGTYFKNKKLGEEVTAGLKSFISCMKEYNEFRRGVCSSDTEILEKWRQCAYDLGNLVGCANIRVEEYETIKRMIDACADRDTTEYSLMCTQLEQETTFYLNSLLKRK